MTWLGVPRPASSSIPTTLHTCPGVQYPHWNASESMNACWTGWSPSAESPAAVTTSLPSCATANDRHEVTRRSSTNTVHDPH